MAPYEAYYANHGLDEYVEVFRHNEEKSIELQVLRNALAGWLAMTSTLDRRLELLDIGCGTGDFVHQLGETVFSGAPGKLEFDCDILDVNPAGFDQATVGCDAVHGTGLHVRRRISRLWQETPREELAQSYDLLISNHVFYSCPINHEETQRLLDLLKPGGVAIVALASEHSEVTQMRKSVGLQLQTAEDFEATLLHHWIDFTRYSYKNRMDYDPEQKVFSRWLFGGSEAGKAEQQALLARHTRAGPRGPYIQNAAAIHVIRKSN